MSDRKKHHPSSTEAEISPVAEPAVNALGESPGSPSSGEAATRLEDEVAALKDRHLRLAAEFDNYRKRTARERSELWSKAQAELVARLADALDDLSRFAHVDPAQTDARTLHDGIDLVERKFWKELQAAGVVRLDQVGVPFDPKVHEAVTTAPAADASLDHTVGAILQAGYVLGETLLRPARVQVLTWPSDAH